MTEPVGIDLGTTYSAVAAFVNGRYEVLPNENGNRITPSVVCITDDQRLVGDAAKSVAHKHPTSTVYDVKRLMGCQFKDPTVKKDATRWAFEIGEDKKSGAAVVEIDLKEGKKQFSPEEISAMVLANLKSYAEQFLNAKVTDAVITVPANFTNAQRESTKDAARIAGLNVLRIINEPTAAALAYGLDQKSEKPLNVCVFDLGGGTFDVSIVTIDNRMFEVRSTTGDPHLGGEDFDNRLVSYLIESIKEKLSIDVTADRRVVRRLRIEAEKAKRLLSTASFAEIEIENVAMGQPFSLTVSRAFFEEINRDLFELCISRVEKAVKESKVKKEDVHEVLLVGGSSRIPRIQALLSSWFGGKVLSKGIHGDEAVALGAAVQAKSLTATTVDEASPILLDVCALSFGIGVDDATMCRIIERNTKIPIKASKDGFTTVLDNQCVVEVPIYEGERMMAADNHLLGTMYVHDIPPATKGVPQFTVVFRIDLDGCLKVEAIEKRSGRSQSLNINCNTNRLSNAEIQRMVNDAEKFKKQDEEHKKRLLAVSEFHEYLRVAEKGLKAYEAVIDKKKLESIKEAIEFEQVWLAAEAERHATEEVTIRLAALKQLIQPTFDTLYLFSGETDEEQQPT